MRSVPSRCGVAAAKRHSQIKKLETRSCDGASGLRGTDAGREFVPPMLFSDGKGGGAGGRDLLPLRKKMAGRDFKG